MASVAAGGDDWGREIRRRGHCRHRCNQQHGQHVPACTFRNEAKFIVRPFRKKEGLNGSFIPDESGAPWDVVREQIKFRAKPGDRRALPAAADVFPLPITGW